MGHLLMSYSPLFIRGMEAGLVQSRQEFILPDDAYPTLENAFIWREQIRRRNGLQTLGRLRRVLTTVSLGNYTTINGTNTINIFSRLSLISSQPNAEIENGSITNIVITFGAPISQTLTDSTGTGTFVITGAGPIISASINYSTGIISITANAGSGPAATTLSAAYYPNLPVMGLRSRELSGINNEEMIAFDTIYAYRFIGSGFEEFIPGTTWSGSNSDFFWTTNYWTIGSNKIFWVTNFSINDPIRYTEGTVWTDFEPALDVGGTIFLEKCLCILPFRSRLVVFNTFEGADLATSTQFPQRIRWAAIGNPLAADAWEDDIRGKGGFLDIPTAENIVSVGFVRDNLVIYCERSTWQLRYTGRSIAPFQIEKVNTELGAESTFSTVQFDTSLVGIGDKGVVECDSYKSERIDIKIPDLVYEFNNNSDPVAHTDNTNRVYGIRDFQQRLAYWTYPYEPVQVPNVNDTFPNRRLIYNYENDSWAIFTDSLTCFGTYQSQLGLRWQDCKFAWETANFPWISRPSLFPSLVAGNQQGFVIYVSSNLQPLTNNQPTLYIQAITPDPIGQTATIITSPDHNLETGFVVKLSDIISLNHIYETLNNQIFGIVALTRDTFSIYSYSSTTDLFDDPNVLDVDTYIGNGKISVRDNFNVTSKKFNFLDQGENIQMGYVDVLLEKTSNGALTLNVYLDYNNNSPINKLPQNKIPETSLPDPFFNTTVETSNTFGIDSSKNWKRVFCAVRGGFVTLQWTLSNAQMAGVEQENYVQIDSQILWIRKAGKQLPVGV